MLPAPFGVADIETRFEARIGAYATAQLAGQHLCTYDALVIAAFGVPALTGLPKDTVINDFAFPDVPAAGGAAIDIISFYNDPNITNNRKVAEFISQTISRVALACRIDVYPLDTPGKLAGTSPLGSPVASAPWTLGPGNGTAALPSEIAIVTSFHADLLNVLEHGPVSANLPSSEAAIDQGAPAVHSGVTRPRARRRGRIYIGPLQGAALTTDITTEGRPVAALITALKESSARLQASVISDWGVWSRRDAAVRSVVGGFIDNALDTKRRRGQAALTRSVWP